MNSNLQVGMSFKGAGYGTVAELASTGKTVVKNFQFTTNSVTDIALGNAANELIGVNNSNVAIPAKEANEFVKILGLELKPYNGKVLLSNFDRPNGQKVILVKQQQQPKIKSAGDSMLNVII